MVGAIDNAVGEVKETGGIADRRPAELPHGGPRRRKCGAAAVPMRAAAAQMRAAGAQMRAAAALPAARTISLHGDRGGPADQARPTAGAGRSGDRVLRVRGLVCAAHLRPLDRRRLLRRGPEADLNLTRLLLLGLRDRDLQHAALEARRHLIRIDALGQRERAGEGAERALQAVVALLLLVLDRPLPGDREHAVLHLNGHVLLTHAGEIGADEVVIGGLHQIHRGDPPPRGGATLGSPARARLVKEGVEESVHLVLDRVELRDGLPADECHSKPPWDLEGLFTPSNRSQSRLVKFFRLRLWRATRLAPTRGGFRSAPLGAGRGRTQLPERAALDLAHPLAAQPE